MMSTSSLPARKTSLGVVVPLYQIDGQLEKLQAWLTIETLESVKVVLVIDKKRGELTPNIDSLIKSLPHPNCTFICGDFSSPGLARNAGLEVIVKKSNWIAFWDSDDSPNVNEFLQMIHNADSQEKDVAVGGFEIREFFSNEVLATHTVQNRSVSDLGRNVGLWRWAFRADVIEDLRFREFRMGEDQDYLFELDPSSTQILFYENIVYSYFKGRKGQATANKSLVKEIKDSYLFLLNQLWLNPKSISELRLKILIGQFLSTVKFGDPWTKVTAALVFPKCFPSYFQHLVVSRKGRNRDV